MPAPIVTVHDDAQVLRDIACALRAVGYEVAEFASSMEALNALEKAVTTRLLITRFTFPAGQPNGVSLAQMIRYRRPSVKILFVGHPRNERHAEGVGEFLPTSVTAHQVMEAAKTLLDGRPA
jgi:DNA-binding NtrC family response regulator